MTVSAETRRFTEYVARLKADIPSDYTADNLEIASLTVVSPPVGNMVWVDVTFPNRGVSIRLEPWGDWEDHPLEEAAEAAGVPFDVYMGQLIQAGVQLGTAELAAQAAVDHPPVVAE